VSAFNFPLPGGASADGALELAVRQSVSLSQTSAAPLRSPSDFPDPIGRAGQWHATVPTNAAWHALWMTSSPSLSPAVGLCECTPQSPRSPLTTSLLWVLHVRRDAPACTGSEAGQSHREATHNVAAATLLVRSTKFGKAPIPAAMDRRLGGEINSRTDRST